MFRRGPAETVDPTWKGVYRVGGIAMMATGALYYAFIVMGSIIGPAPSSGDDYYNALAAHTTVAQALFWIFIVSDLLLLPGLLAFYFALKGVNQNAMTLAAAIVALYLIFDIAVTETASLTLVTLIQQSASATTDAQRTAYAAAADFARATLPMATFLSWFLGCVGWLIVNVVMLRGSFVKATAALGIAFSVEGILGSFYLLVPAFTVLLNPALATFGIWCIFSGIRFLTLSRRTAKAPFVEARNKTTST